MAAAKTFAVIPAGRQRGAVLVISLLFLLIITLVATGSMNSTLMEEKMAANSQYQTVSFQVAESAIQRYAKPSAVKQTLAYPGADFELPAEQTDLGNAFDPVVGGEVITRAEARVIYCGERSPPGTGKDAALNKNSAATKLHAFAVRGRGAVDAVNAVTVNERVVGFLAPAAGLKQCGKF